MLNESTSIAIASTPPHGSAEGAAEGFELFHTPAGRAFADIRVNGHRETYAVPSDVFRRWLLVGTVRTGEPDAPTKDEVCPLTRPNSPSAPSATGQQGDTTTAQDNPIQAPAIDTAQHDPRSKPIDSVEQLSNADSADSMPDAVSP